MKETWYAAYCPTTLLWDAKPIVPDFPDDCWIYKTSARNGHEALKQGFDQHAALLTELSPTELKVAQLIVRQVTRVDREASAILMIDIPLKYHSGAETMAERGFFTLAHQEEVLIQTASAGWKALQQHVEKNHKLEDECDFAQLA